MDLCKLQKRCFFDYNLNPYQVIKNVTIELLKKKIMKKKEKKSHAFIIAPPNTEAQQVNSRQNSLSALIKNGH